MKGFLLKCPSPVATAEKKRVWSPGVSTGVSPSPSAPGDGILFRVHERIHETLTSAAHGGDVHVLASCFELRVDQVRDLAAPQAPKCDLFYDSAVGYTRVRGVSQHRIDTGAALRALLRTGERASRDMDADTTHDNTYAPMQKHRVSNMAMCACVCVFVCV